MEALVTFNSSSAGHCSSCAEPRGKPARKGVQAGGATWERLLNTSCPDINSSQNRTAALASGPQALPHTTLTATLSGWLLQVTPSYRWESRGSQRYLPKMTQESLNLTTALSAASEPKLFIFLIQILTLLVAQSYPTLCDPMDCSQPGSSVQGIFQARILEGFAISFSRGSSWRRDWTWVSCTAGRFFTYWVTRE